MSKLQSLFRDTVLYGLSSIVGRFLNYMLVPLYTHTMTAESGNYGIVTNVYAWTALLMALLTFGFETTFFRFANKPGADVPKVLSMSLQVVGTLCAVFLIAVFVNIESIAAFLDYSKHPEFVTIMAVVVALDAVQSILFGYIRYKKRPLKFVGLKLLFIYMSIAMNLVAFLLLPRLHAQQPEAYSFFDPNNQAYYIFLINLVCTSSITVLLFPELSIYRPTADTRLLKEMLSYSWPLLLLGLAGILNLHADKIIYKWLVPGEAGETQLSIYGAVVKIAAIMAMLMQAFRFAYEPLVFDSGKDNKESKEYQAKAMKYFVAISLLAFLAVVFYMDILRYLIGRDYWEGLSVIPLVMLGEIFMGIYFNLSFWYKLNDETWWGAIFSFAACIVLFTVNILFVPKYGYMACGYASMLGYFTAMALSYIVGRRRSPIDYGIKNLLAYAALAAVLYLVSAQLPSGEENMWLRLGVNTILILIYLGYFIKKDIPLKQIPFVNRFFK
ncbi:MAG: lipopolysaccharide biosynthesis protein [Bacteroidaceae bacterium]|nr:lipopolysaccharide biosynthesis protein [Bacteroidaceae bacterium]